MNVRKAVITAAAGKQRTLPLQSLIDRDGVERSVFGIILEEVVKAKIEEICVVVWPGDETAYTKVAGDHAGRLRFVHQSQPLGYGHAVWCAKDFAGQDPFLHLVGDHLYISRGSRSCAQRLIDVAVAEDCAVSSVQPTRENLLPRFGAVAGQPVPGKQNLYRIDTVAEKPTPTQAEQRLVVPGLRSGHYLCFFGMHVLTPVVMEILGRLQSCASAAGVTLSAALAELALREKYLALEETDRRYDVGARYGLFTAQLALALNGCDRSEVLSQMVELLALREPETASK
jgi:UTP--glucose-1-phosphate uridylyltransferase